MKKSTLIIIGIGIFLTSIFFYIESEINKSVKTSLLEDESIKQIEKIDCSLILNKCSIKNISFTNSPSTIKEVNINNIYALAQIQANGIKENKNYQMRIEFLGVEKPFENSAILNNISEELKIQLSKDMSYSFDVEFIKNNDFYTTDFSINIGQDSFKFDINFNGVLKIDQHMQLIQALSKVNSFKMNIIDENNLINSLIYDTYENMLTMVSPRELNIELFGIDSEEKLSSDDLLSMMIALIKSQSKSHKNIVVNSDNPKNINIELIPKGMAIDDILNMQNEDFLKKFMITIK